ncbi:uncharacterized protein LOC103502414 isoform X2 [Cucumis melo]|uniref:Uncharacterized protein LOC103502414 isoform X2 n=1 Tax=Cucumis melo TaxID=3656 RepID=A0ABM3L0H1_CUCME|nr:uncharacterized protein LOC103502414 isoform X2 [Cucumis melo]
MSRKADMKKEVVKCLINLIHKHGGWIDNDGSIFLPCDTILNVLLKGFAPLLGKFDFTELFLLFESSVICSSAPLLGLQKKCIYKSKFAMHECYTKHRKEIGSSVGGTYFSS